MRLINDCLNTFVSVPNTFIDHYMSKASGDFVKVYLFLLRCMQSGLELSISSIADSCCLTENDILRALIYWDKANVLALEIDEKKISGIRFLDLARANETASGPPAASSFTEAAPTGTAGYLAPEAPSAKPQDTKPARREYTRDEVKAFRNNPDISELLFVLETYIKHPLSATEMNVVFYWIDELKFSKELVEYLVEYCISGGHTSLRYMEKVALSWAENDISTVEQAKELSAIRSKAYYMVVKSFGITGRNLVDAEMAFINRWTREYGFDLDLIQEACKRTISATQKPSFEYADSILNNWKQKNVHNIKDVAALDAAHIKAKKASPAANSANVRHNHFNNFNQRTYDYDELEKILLTTSV
uniref:DnaD domain protein n=1 Tax=Agathobacter sp. TaxID=2021311 RepID=UPI00405706C7